MKPYAEARAAIDDMRDALADRACELGGAAGVDAAIFFSALGELFFNAGIQMIGPEVFREALQHMLAQLDETTRRGAAMRPH